MMKIRLQQTPDQSRTLCWCPNHRKAMRQRVSNPDCAADARPRSRREQDPLPIAPLSIGGESPLRARSLASSFLGAISLTTNRLDGIVGPVRIGNGVCLLPRPREETA